MENSCLCELVKKFKERDMSVFPVIFSEFEGLIYKYSLKLNCEGLDFEEAFQELSVFLIELLYSIRLNAFKSQIGDGLQRYIAVSIRNKYIALSKSSVQKESYPYCENRGSGNFDLTISIALREALSQLSPKQRTAIIYKYIYLYSDREIASALNVSRQAVNRLINRGLQALKEFFK